MIVTIHRNVSYDANVVVKNVMQMRRVIIMTRVLEIRSSILEEFQGIGSYFWKENSNMRGIECLRNFDACVGIV